jgi:hypothetical protein
LILLRKIFKNNPGNKNLFNKINILFLYSRNVGDKKHQCSFSSGGTSSGLACSWVGYSLFFSGFRRKAGIFEAEGRLVGHLELGALDSLQGAGRNIPDLSVERTPSGG